MLYLFTELFINLHDAQEQEQPSLAVSDDQQHASQLTSNLSAEQAE